MLSMVTVRNVVKVNSRISYSSQVVDAFLAVNWGVFVDLNFCKQILYRLTLLFATEGFTLFD